MCEMHICLLHQWKFLHIVAVGCTKGKEIMMLLWDQTSGRLETIYFYLKHIRRCSYLSEFLVQTIQTNWDLVWTTYKAYCYYWRLQTFKERLDLGPGQKGRKCQPLPPPALNHMEGLRKEKVNNSNKGENSSQLYTFGDCCLSELKVQLLLFLDS